MKRWNLLGKKGRRRMKKSEPIERKQMDLKGNIQKDKEEI